MPGFPPIRKCPEHGTPLRRSTGVRNGKEYESFYCLVCRQVSGRKGGQVMSNRAETKNMERVRMALLSCKHGYRTTDEYLICRKCHGEEMDEILAKLRALTQTVQGLNMELVRLQEENASLKLIDHGRPS